MCKWIKLHLCFNIECNLCFAVNNVFTYRPTSFNMFSTDMCFYLTFQLLCLIQIKKKIKAFECGFSCLILNIIAWKMIIFLFSHGLAMVCNTVICYICVCEANIILNESVVIEVYCYILKVYTDYKKLLNTVGF